jgi:hypothetical protein
MVPLLGGETLQNKKSRAADITVLLSFESYELLIVLLLISILSNNAKMTFQNNNKAPR